MKKIIYTGLIFLFAIAVTSCEKNYTDYDAIPASEMAQFQITHFTPVERKPAYSIYRVELDGKLLSNERGKPSSVSVLVSKFNIFKYRKVSNLLPI